MLSYTLSQKSPILYTVDQQYYPTNEDLGRTKCKRLPCHARKVYLAEDSRKLPVTQNLFISRYMRNLPNYSYI